VGGLDCILSFSYHSSLVVERLNIPRSRSYPPGGSRCSDPRLPPDPSLLSGFELPSALLKDRQVVPFVEARVLRLTASGETYCPGGGSSQIYFISKVPPSKGFPFIFSNKSTAALESQYSTIACLFVSPQSQLQKDDKTERQRRRWEREQGEGKEEWNVRSTITPPQRFH
jgi:hypothetical protein